MQNSDNLSFKAPSLPKGGGALTGLSGTMGAIGPDGAASLSLPLPITLGREYAPALGLGYSSQSGNGPLGMGWSVGTLAVRRSTSLGVPGYTSDDEFLAPDGEVLVPILSDSTTPLVTTRDSLLGISLNANYRVTTYRSRVESDFSRLEYWQPAASGEATDFWVQYSTDGQVHLLGYEAQACISDPAAASHTAQWLLNASVSATGEQIYYRYRAEDDANCNDDEKNAHPDATAQRYLSEAHYGNITAERAFPCLNDADALSAGWLFVLVFDYGERSTALADVPPFIASSAWRCRQDSFSGYEYGFELRTRRLCHQVLMFHRLTTLAADDTGNDIPALVSRLVFAYQESPFVSLLTSATQMAFDNDSECTPVALPPQVFSWQTFSELASSQAEWQKVEMGNLNPQQPWQYLDLLGEGLAGLLYQDSGAWWYRSPVRNVDSENINAVVWESPRPLPRLPSLQGSATLADLNGDGRLQWVVSAAGVNGYYDQNVDVPGEWLHFTPLSALPVEYAHPRAQLADLIGRGFSDLVLIGPRSVRLYAGQGDGWELGQTVLQSGGVTLPIPGADAKTLVAFSDALGSGQQHLLQVRAEGITCWPNTGQGRFGQPLTLPGFSQPAQIFNPDSVFLADIDGSGTTDVIYAHADRLEIYRNQSGNGFAPPFVVNLPDGVRYDRTCQLQVADVQGLGVASVLLSVSHLSPSHWVLNLSEDKPWLLSAVNNSMGAHQKLHYRSSAQFWLDEKADARKNGNPVPGCYLPFPLHTMWRTDSLDEITGNRLVSEIRYRHGAWDGREREFRGFGYVEVQDTDIMAAQGDAGNIAPPTLTRTWYATGIGNVDDSFAAEYWAGDDAAFSALPPRYTLGYGEEEVVCPSETRSSLAFWLARAVKGTVLRSEVYGLDGSEQSHVPYNVTQSRPQVRLISALGAMPVVWPSVIEQCSYHYERVAADPQCAQTITLYSDEFGLPLHQVSVNYPRRPAPADSPYPATLPETLFASSYDSQQQVLRLTLSRNSWHNLASLEAGEWLLGLPDASRHDALTFNDDKVPDKGFTIEVLTRADSLIGEAQPRVFGGQQQVFWLDKNNQPSCLECAFPPRQAYTEAAEFDESMVQAMSVSFENMDFPNELARAGYLPTEHLFARLEEAGKTLWAVRSGTTDYGDSAQFWRPMAYRASPLTGCNTLTWDAHYCVVTQHDDAAGLTVSAQYDWRFLAPVRINDVNDNVHEVTLDALGRVTSSRFFGTENGHLTGYSNTSFQCPSDADGALALTAPLPVAQCYLYITDSWMRAGQEKMPPHVVMLSTDRYDADPGQQIQQQVGLSDGFGRVLQAAVRHEAGEAWLRAEDGHLTMGENGMPVTTVTDFRWAVSGRTEYDNKGQAIRTYQPYFLNDWRYVCDDSARQDLWADTHHYDPVGRVTAVTTARGYLRRTLFTPWFSVQEDENDTATAFHD